MVATSHRESEPVLTANPDLLTVVDKYSRPGLVLVVASTCRAAHRRAELRRDRDDLPAGDLATSASPPDFNAYRRDRVKSFRYFPYEASWLKLSRSVRLFYSSSATTSREC